MNKKKGRVTVLLLTALAIGLLPATSCSSYPSNATVPQNNYTATTAQENTQVIQQYIPPQYYACTETTPQNLAQAYFLRYFNVAEAENNFTGQFFVFKNVMVKDYSLKYATDDYIWVDSIIQCYFLKSGSAKELKAGELVDVVGIDAGMGKDYSGTLIFKGCIFLPAGSVQLPAAGTSGLAVPFY